MQMKPLERGSAPGSEVGKACFTAVETVYTLPRCRPNIPGMPDEPGHLLRRDFVGCNDEIAFVFSVLIVQHNDKLPLSNVGDCILDGVKARTGS